MATSASSSSFSSSTRTGQAVGIAAGWGALLGVAAAMVMAAYAMIAAATYQNTGFFTPLYHIASTVIAPDTMMTSVERAGAGSLFYFSFGPAVLGAVIHIMVGAVYGALFAVIARVTALHGLPVLTMAGIVWGLLVFAISTWIGLPLAAAIFGGGEPIRDMAGMVGYPTFIAEHLLFGAALGMMLAWRTGRR
ncbi:hypothetical protein [Nocardia sp. CC227C]|uniref:hypothetical protein n=1 Tax=Nocardia sp. CC227C TaxID=3044562 RepID=UPI00278C79DE|nr:hypothetical protein [Nocardia sp. CC227C]